MSYTILNPANEHVVTTVEHLDLAETDAAIARAAVAQRSWAAVSPADRAQA
ncbi:aldehyde dehydrogenase family protein, partial [Plantibacter sp. CFBP 13570]